MSQGNPGNAPSVNSAPAKSAPPVSAPRGFIGLSELADDRLTAADLLRLLPAAILSICLNAGLVVGLLIYNAEARAENLEAKKQTITAGGQDSRTTVDDTPASKPQDFIALDAPRVDVALQQEVKTSVPDVRPLEKPPEQTGLEPPPPELKEFKTGIGQGNEGGIQGLELGGREGLDALNLMNSKYGALPSVNGNAPIGDGSGLLGGDGAGLRTAGGFGLRGNVDQIALREGATEESQRAVARGLAWLARHQAPSGRWSLDKYNTDCAGCTCKSANERGRADDTAATALALMAFLGAGHTHTKKESPYHGVVYRGLNFLIKQQDSRGAFQGGGQPMYSHALGTIAICEAYAMTKDQALRRPAQKAVDYLVYAQNPSDGGWRYQPRTDGDTSVVGWCVMALQSAKLGGLNVPANTLELAKKWLDSCGKQGNSRYSYVPNSGPTPSMTSVGLLCRQYLGWGYRNPDLHAGAKYLLETSLPAEKDSLRGANQPIGPIYTYYYATQVMHHMEGEFFDRWNPRMRDLLVSTQNVDETKHTYGSWNPEGTDYGPHAGRIYSTTLAILTLEVYYRYMPLYRSTTATPEP